MGAPGFSLDRVLLGKRGDEAGGHSGEVSPEHREPLAVEDKGKGTTSLPFFFLIRNPILVGFEPAYRHSTPLLGAWPGSLLLISDGMKMTHNSPSPRPGNGLTCTRKTKPGSQVL